MISSIASDYGVSEDKDVDPEEVANELDDIVEHSTPTLYLMH